MILDFELGCRSKLSTAFPHLAVFSPPASDGNSGLPYIDRSIDVVVLASQDARDLAEARRVATAAVVNLKRLAYDEPGQRSFDTTRQRTTLDIEWQENEDHQASSTGVSIIIPVYNKSPTQTSLSSSSRLTDDSRESHRR